MSSKAGSVVFGTFVIFCIFVLFASAVYFKHDNMPTKVSPGDPVAILIGKTVVENGSACQQYIKGSVNPISPDGNPKWYGPDRILFPTKSLISVITDKNILMWKTDYRVVKLPGTEKDLLCQNPVN